MKPAAFKYEAPTTVPEVCGLLWHGQDECKLLAGGQSLGPLLNLRLSTPSTLVDLRRVTELTGAPNRHGHMMRLSAMTTYQQMLESQDVLEYAPLLAEAIPFVGHQAIRNAGTVGGSVGHADPAAELPTALLALDASVRIRGTVGDRAVRISEFFTGVFSTALGEAEVIEAVDVPVAGPNEGSAWIEVAPRHGDYAVVGVGAVVEVLDGVITRARVALSNISDTPYLATSAASLCGAAPSTGAVDEVAHAISHEIEPRADLVSSVAYKRHLIDLLTRRALTTALGRVRRPVSGV